MTTLTALVRRRSLGAAALLAAAAASGACHLQISHQAEARDEWRRTYTLAERGSVELRATNGRVAVETGEGSAVEVVAVRTARAATDQAAKDTLARFRMDEKISADRIVIDASTGGLLFLAGQSAHVDFRVRVPATAGVTVKATNADISVSDLGGPFQADATNGRVTATGLRHGADVETTNGAIDLAFAALDEGDIRCRTTNGAIAVTVPRTVRAAISARVTNGSIGTSGLDLAVAEQTRRRLDATAGGGGRTIRLETTNGRIEVNGR